MQCNSAKSLMALCLAVAGLFAVSPLYALAEVLSQEELLPTEAHQEGIWAMDTTFNPSAVLAQAAWRGAGFFGQRQNLKEEFLEDNPDIVERLEEAKELRDQALEEREARWEEFLENNPDLAERLEAAQELRTEVLEEGQARWEEFLENNPEAAARLEERRGRFDLFRERGRDRGDGRGRR